MGRGRRIRLSLMPTDFESVEILGGEEEVSLLEILDHVLNSGVVIHGSLVISLAGVDLVYLGLNVVLTSVETALNNLQIEEKRKK
jgi:gas vesicle protein GvpA/GvpJ/GvpM family